MEKAFAIKKAFEINSEITEDQGEASDPLEDPLAPRPSDFKYIDTISSGRNQLPVKVKRIVSYDAKSEDSTAVKNCEVSESSLGCPSEECKLRRGPGSKKRLFCDICCFVGASAAIVRRHMLNIHRITFLAICIVCNKRYASKVQITYHMKTDHNINRKLLCEICNYRGNSVHNVKRHVLAVHRKSSNKCFDCNRYFISDAHWMEHLSYDHKSIDNQLDSNSDKNNSVNPVTLNKLTELVCGICNFRTRLVSELRMHFATIHKGILYSSDCSCLEGTRKVALKHHLLANDNTSQSPKPVSDEGHSLSETTKS